MLEAPRSALFLFSDLFQSQEGSNLNDIRKLFMNWVLHFHAAVRLRSCKALAVDSFQGLYQILFFSLSICDHSSLGI